MDEQNKSEVDDNSIPFEEVVRFVGMTTEQQIDYLIEASHKAFPSAPPKEEPGNTTFEDVVYKHVVFEGILWPGQTFNLNPDAPEVIYVGYSEVTTNLLVKPISAHAQLMKHEYLLVSRYYMQDRYLNRKR